MAAGLQSFQSNDKQMQAIRELTNEVFNLKNKDANLDNDISAINDSIDTINSSLFKKIRVVKAYFEPYSLGANASLVGNLTITDLPEGATLVSGRVLYLVDSNNTRIDNVNIGFSYSATPNFVAYKMINPTSSAITIYGAVVEVFYTL